MLNALRFTPLLQSLSQTVPKAALGYAQTAAVSRDVPEGHASSDLSNTACNIGLNRRRDLTLRQDLSLFKDNSQYKLSDIFRGKKIMLVGFPGGKVCTEQHVPGYVSMAEKLAQKGVDKVVCVSVEEPERLQQWARANQISEDKVDIYADKTGGFVRLLGLELGPEAEGGPKCQRFAGIVEDGILLKLKVEKAVGELKVSDCPSMMKLWDEVYE